MSLFLLHYDDCSVMGLKISILLGFALMASAGGSYFYINMQKDQISQLQVELQTAGSGRHDCQSEHAVAGATRGSTTESSAYLRAFRG